MFISNQISKFLLPTAIALVFTGLAQWLTSETERLSAFNESLLTTPPARSKTSTRQTQFPPKTQTPNRQHPGIGIGSTSPRRHSTWMSHWRDRSMRWRQHIEAFWLDNEAGTRAPTIGTDGSVALSPVTQAVSYERKPLDPQIRKLFSTPDSPGAIAIGAAEGTRTASGGITPQYWGHRDPGNGVTNLGTFSYQHGASNALDADAIQLERLRYQVADIQLQAKEAGLTLSTLELVAAADLTNQSPEAGYAYIANLLYAYDRGLRGIEALLEARMQSFVNPQTQDLDAAGFSNSWQKLRQDQLRRLSKLQKTLKAHGEI